MTEADRCWGIYRESAHSPGRVDDDRGILESVGLAMQARGVTVELLAAEQADAVIDRAGANIFAMCECGEMLDRLQDATRLGSMVINEPAAIKNTYRHRTIELFAKHKVPTPTSRVIATDTQALFPVDGVWIKRYDYHATKAEDVLYAASPAGWREGLSRFAANGIPYVVVQDHVPGDLVKFYGVGTADADAATGWFQWFYHRDKGMSGYAFNIDQLRAVARHAARALGVEIFGGDAIIRPDGQPVIIDLNAWPSFAKYRDQAASAIADHLSGRFRRRLRVISQ